MNFIKEFFFFVVTVVALVAILIALHDMTSVQSADFSALGNFFKLLEEFVRAVSVLIQ